MCVINQEELAEATGYTRPAEIAACLARQGVRYFSGKRGRIWTTQAALNHALGLPVEPIAIISRNIFEQDQKKRVLKWR